MPLLQIENLSKTFHLHQFEGKRITACTDINLTLKHGAFIGITGKSGAGKSTILKCIYRTYIPTEGTMVYESDCFGRIDLAKATEREIVDIRLKEIGYVSQFLKLLPRITALEAVEQELVAAGSHVAAASAEARAILSHFGLSPSLWDTYPNTFSGGEKLRLNLARAMVKRPKFLLLDEPTASLDNGSKEAVRDMIMDLKKQGTSMIGIFHDLDFMEKVVDEEYNMRDGRLMGV
ncbi:phosphonate C-P lyase system protein PhnL [Cohnella abietis]|uniref:ABC transporter n=1 Tax=Cohnella abietis TaxID=2507935 RepID=A0A3T1DCV6_9BACL|nr:ATP-binding cassette domain-containing protein [Cohnella abietis]BBI35927.1 ABC transporter [Cohnella abietis]